MTASKRLSTSGPIGRWIVPGIHLPYILEFEEKVTPAGVFRNVMDLRRAIRRSIGHFDLNCF